jgi:hypothetical protein
VVVAAVAVVDGNWFSWGCKPIRLCYKQAVTVLLLPAGLRNSAMNEMKCLVITHVNSLGFHTHLFYLMASKNNI